MLCRRVVPKKILETDAIFAHLAQVNAHADADVTVLRLSLDAKASVKVGAYSRGGPTRMIVQAADHDFRPDCQLTPLGILLPHSGEVYLYFTDSKVTSDFMADCLRDCWLKLRERFPQVKTLLLNLDNGPESHSRRTQFMYRLTQLVDAWQLTLDLAYYPPYHSKYNPIERVWGVLEQHWNGSLLESCATVLKFAQSMTFRGLPPVVQLIRQIYPTGVRLTPQHMATLEGRFERLPNLPKWFVKIAPLPSRL